MPRNMSTSTAKTDRRGGVGLRFWNFVDRVTIGPSGETGVGRRTGGRI